MRFRKKTYEVDAFQFNGENDFIDNDFFAQLIEDEQVYFQFGNYYIHNRHNTEDFELFNGCWVIVDIEDQCVYRVLSEKRFKKEFDPTLKEIQKSKDVKLNVTLDTKELIGFIEKWLDEHKKGLL